MLPVTALSTHPHPVLHHPLSPRDLLQCFRRQPARLPMQHDSLSEEVTPVSDPAPRSSTRVIVQKPWKTARLKIHSSLKSTPVSLRSRSPFTPIVLNSRTAAQAAADVHVVKRKLFSVASTPRKRRRGANTPKARLQPRLFRISGGKERTQPVETGSARKPLRLQGGVLTGQIGKCVATSALNLRVFRTALGAAELDLREINALVRKSLVLRVLRREDDLFVARRWSHNDSAESYDDDFAVVIPQDAFSEDEAVDFRQVVLYVPEPWSLVKLSTSFPSRSGVLVVPHKLELIDLKTMSTVLEKCTLNGEIGTWQQIGGTEDSEYEVPETQDPEEENDNCMTSAGGEAPLRNFSSISPHATTASVSVVVDVVLPEFGMAVIRDSRRDLALYQQGSEQIQITGEQQDLSDVKIRPQRMPVESIISLLSCVSRNITEAAAVLDRFRLLPNSYALLVFTKHDSS